MPSREINWGGANSPYTTHVDKDGNGRVVLAEDTDGNTVLLEYDESAGEWIYGGPVDMGGGDISNAGEIDATAVSAERVNSVTYVQSGETLNDALNRTTLPAIVKVPTGETTFTDPIGPTDTLIIVGQGKDTTTLRSDGSNRFLQTGGGSSDDVFVLEGATVDMNQVSTDGRIFNWFEDRQLQRFSDVRFTNINLSGNNGISRGLINQGSAQTERFEFERCEFRLDTTTNIPNAKYQLLNVGPADAPPDVVYVGDGNVFYGVPFRADGEDFITGFQTEFNEFFYGGGTWHDWGQYAYQPRLVTEGGSAVIDVQMKGIGNGDQINPRFEAWGDVKVDAVIHDASGTGDRAVIFGGSDDFAMFRNVAFDVTVSNMLVPLEIRGGRNIEGTLRVYDSGHTGSLSSANALELKDAAGVIENFNIKANILNEGIDRTMTRAVFLRENNGDFGAGPHVLEGFAHGYETEKIDDQTDTGTEINTSRFFDRE